VFITVYVISKAPTNHDEIFKPVLACGGVGGGKQPQTSKTEREAGDSLQTAPLGLQPQPWVRDGLSRGTSQLSSFKTFLWHRCAEVLKVTTSYPVLYRGNRCVMPRAVRYKAENMRQ